MKQFLIVLFLCSVCFGVADSNLVAYYRMDDRSDSNRVIDDIGTDGNSIINTSLMDAYGKVNGALEFNGTSDYVDTGRDFNTTFQNSFTVNFWVKLDDGIPNDYSPEFFGVSNNNVVTMNVVSIYRVVSTGQMCLRYAANCLSASRVFLTESEPYTFTDGQQPWIMLTMVITQLTPTTVNGKLYVNGVLKDTSATKTQTMSNYTYAQNPYIGNTNALGSPIANEFTAGLFDEFRIFSKALSVDEISQLYEDSLEIYRWNERDRYRY